MNDPKVEKQPPVPPFVQFCVSAVPQVFDNSMSYYETVCALWKYLDDTVKVINNNAMITEDFIAKVNELHDYVENYFANLDVQEEINNKLDEMALDGTLQEIITQYIQANVAWCFDTVADMKASTNLIAGSYAQTLGFHAIGDGGGAIYKITDSGTANEMDIIAIGDLRANLVINGDIKPELFGAYGDGTHNDSNSFNRCLAYAASKEISYNNEVIAPAIRLSKDYVIDKLSIPQGMSCVHIIGEKARIRGGGFSFNGSTGWKVRIEGIIFDTCEDPIDMDYRNLEYGRYEVINCNFNRCSGIAVNIDRRSAQTLIERCTFRGCEKSVKCSNSDHFMFKNNWLECTSTYPWGDNHYDVEHYVPYGGAMVVQDNLFIPGYVQTGTNPCWLKAGGSAIIENNRFSGENTSIHPLYISYDQLVTFNVNSSMYPIIDFVKNPVVAGSTAIVLGKTVGTLNIIENCGWAGGMKVLVCENAEATTYYQDLDYSFFTIAFSNNAGRTFNMRNGRTYTIAAAYDPSVDAVLGRFIKNGITYQKYYNYELKTSLSNSNHTLDLEYCFGTDTIDIRKTYPVIISGKLNKGGGDYFEPFVAIVSFQKYYEGSEYRVRAFAKILTENNQALTLECLVNGQAYMTTFTTNPIISITAAGLNPAVAAEFFGVDTLYLPPVTNKLGN